MKEIKNRRAFLQYVTKGILTGVLTFSSFKFGNSFELIPLGDQRDNQIPRINPAYRMNVLNDGTVELYTHTSIGVKVVHTFKGFEAFTAATLVYVAISFLITGLVTLYSKRVLTPMKAK